MKAIWLRVLIGCVVGYLASVLVQPIDFGLGHYAAQAPRVLTGQLAAGADPVAAAMFAEVSRVIMTRAWAGLAIGGLLGWAWARWAAKRMG